MRYFKFLFTFLIIFFVSVNTCFAKEEYIDTDVIIEDDGIKLSISVKDDIDVYGFLGTINYDSDKFQFDGCKSDLFDVSVENDILLLEGIKGYSNSVIAVCNFSVIDGVDKSLISIKDISLSDGSKVIYNDNADIEFEYIQEENKEDETIVKNPTTYGAFIIIPFIITVIALVQ